MGKKLDIAIGILNGTVGDHLARTENALATDMAFYRRGEKIALTREGVARAYPNARAKIVILAHGLMNTEDAFTMKDGGDYGARLEQDLGFSAFYVRYNSGRAIPDNGASFAALVERLCNVYPVEIEQIILVGYSMGGLVIRSACHAAASDARGAEKMAWLSRVKKAIYVGTPHLGAPLERAGRALVKLLRAIPDPYTELIADIANLRSAGLQDLGDADLTHAHRGLRRASLSLRDPSHPIPLIADVSHYLICGSVSVDPRAALFFGDVLVPVPSATDGQITDEAALALPPSHIKFFPGTSHIDIPRDEKVYETVRAFCEEA